MENNDKIYFNRANVVTAYNHVGCERCAEPVVFALKDSTHEFSVGLSTILDCLMIAEQEGYVPKIPDGWWTKALNRVEE